MQANFAQDEISGLVIAPPSGGISRYRSPPKLTFIAQLSQLKAECYSKTLTKSDTDNDNDINSPKFNWNSINF